MNDGDKASIELAKKCLGNLSKLLEDTKSTEDPSPTKPRKYTNNCDKLEVESPFYISSLKEVNPQLASILFIHGGPGNNSELFELVASNIDCYLKARFNLFFYDQRCCGRSTDFDLATSSHQKNIEDISTIIKEIEAATGAKLDAIMGHSYGARLAYNFSSQNNETSVKPILLGMAPDFKIPRTRSFLMDILNIKINQIDEFESVKNHIAEFPKPYWEHASETREFVKDKSLRESFYWAMPRSKNMIDEFKASLTLPYSNNTTFEHQRKDLYADHSNFTGPDSSRIRTDYLWINGLYDFMMAGETLDIFNSSISSASIQNP